MLEKINNFFTTPFDMSLFLNNLSNFFTPEIMNAFIIFICGICIIFFLRIIADRKKTQKLKEIEIITSVKMKKKSTTIHYFKDLKNALNGYCVLKPDKQQSVDNFYYTIIIIEFVLALISLYFKKPLFAFFLPLIIHYFMIIVVKYLTVNIHQIVLRDLSDAIKHMIKIFSKTSDLKTVLYETSKTMADPLKSKFFNLSRRMLSENYEKCLLEFADEIDNIWMYAFVFLLSSYKEQSKKEDIIINLRALSNILDTENYTKQKSLSEKKPMALLNYVLLIIGIVAGVANMLLNDFAKDFFFNSMTGMICFTVSIGAIFVTIIINLMLTHNKEGS